jgi:hypothetical protein
MSRKLALIAGLLAAFAAIVTVLLAALPGPRRATDYLVIGAIATFICLLLLFVALTKTTL